MLPFPPPDIYTVLTTMVSVLAGAIWPALGLVPNPATGQVDRNFDQARLGIDLCDFIVRRLDGHVPRNTYEALQRTVADLKLNYVEQQSRAQRESQERAQASESPSAGDDPD